MGFADRLAGEVKKYGTKCTTCVAIAHLPDDERTEYLSARKADAYPLAVFARVLGVRPDTFRQHVASGHESD